MEEEERGPQTSSHDHPVIINWAFRVIIDPEHTKKKRRKRGGRTELLHRETSGTHITSAT